MNDLPDLAAVGPAVVTKQREGRYHGKCEFVGPYIGVCGREGRVYHSRDPDRERMVWCCLQHDKDLRKKRAQLEGVAEVAGEWRG